MLLKAQTAIPFTISPTNHFIIEGKLNETFARFILDSGAGRCCLGAAKAAEMDLVIVEIQQTASGVGEGFMNRFEVLVPQMILGNCVINNATMVGLDLQGVNQSLEGIGESEVYGIIGADLLLEYGVVLDFKKMEADFEGALPFKRMRSNHLVAEVRLAGMEEKVRFIIDTGAGQTCIDLEKIKALGWELKESEEKATGAGGSGMPLSVATIPKMTFGDYVLFEYQMTIMDLAHVNEVLVEMGAKSVDGIIGADVLWDNNGVIDCGTKLLYLEQKKNAQ
ncbi:MAG: retropepsin-like aspartic protease [Chitinophagales bacterium]